uniref:Tetratricopeptide repeat protein n=1 Tax=Thermorudis peleae TaxID=1382356 RepID=A0A831TF32_9BACT
MFEQFGRWLRRRQGIERNPLYRIAAEVAAGRLTPEQAYLAAEQPDLLARIADGDLWELQAEASRIAVDEPEQALLLTRLAILAARQKSFDRVLMEANLRAADLLAEMGETSEQELHLREALRAAQRIANVVGQRRALARLARLAFDRGERERARELLTRQLESGREDTDTLEDVETALMLGDLARQDGDLAAAREFYHRAGRSARRVTHYAGLVDALLRQVAILRDEDPDTAYVLLQEAQEAAERTIDHRLQAEIAIQIGALLAQRGRLTQARSALLGALERARASSDLTMESRCLMGLTKLERRMGKLVESAEHYHQLANLEQRLGSRGTAVRALLDAAELYLEARQPGRALQMLQLAQQNAEGIEDQAVRQRLLGLLGLAHGALDHRGEALDYLGDALQLAQYSGSAEDEARWLLGTGEILLQFGELGNALDAADRAITLAQQAGAVHLEAQGLALLGSVCLARNLTREARSYLDQAVELAAEAGDVAGQQRYLLMLAELARRVTDPHGAIGYLRQALDLAIATGNTEMRARLHGQIARLYQALNFFQEAEEHYRAALAAAHEINDVSLLARALRGLATVLDTTGQAEDAAAAYRQAITLSEQLNDRRSAMALHYNLGVLLIDQGNEADARYHLRCAYDLATHLGEREIVEATLELLGEPFVERPAPAPASIPPDYGEDLLLSETALHEGAEQHRDVLRD